MGTSWNKRHRQETDEYKAKERARYEEAVAKFKTNGKWDESKVSAWMKERLVTNDTADETEEE